MVEGVACLRLTEVVGDGLHLAWGEALVGLAVAALVEGLPQVVAPANPLHEVTDGLLGRGLGEVEQREFLLRVGADFELFRVVHP